jgi:hypothetical protein
VSLTITAPRPETVRAAATGLCAAAVVAVAVPLAVLQIPDAIAWSLPGPFAAAGPNVVASLVRAAGLAVPVMAAAAPFAALATRRLRAGPVLLAGMLAIGAADALGQAARTIPLIEVDRSLHGLGAGISMAAVAAIVAERRWAARTLTGWWACAMVCALAAAPALMRHRVTAEGWRAALQPYPWLAGAALALAALYAILTEGMPVAAVRSTFPATERTLLALLAAPVAGLCTVAVAVSYRGHDDVTAAAIAGAIALAGLAVMTARASTAGPLAAVCAVIGFTVAPAAGAVTALTPPAEFGSEVGCTAVAAALFGAALALARLSAGTGSAGTGSPRTGSARTGSARTGSPRTGSPRTGSARTGSARTGSPRTGSPRTDSARTVIAVGLLVAATAFGAAHLAGPAVPHVRVLSLLCVPLVGGLTAALAAALRGTSTGGALCGVVVLLAGVVGGYLAAGAVQLQALQDARTAADVHGALVVTAARWNLVAAVATATVALALAAATRWRSNPGAKSGVPPAGRAGGTPERG